jgi:hypothetical protein
MAVAPGRAASRREEDVQLPAHMCELEVDRHAWRARVLDFLRGHVEVNETYHLALQDLELAELMPARTGYVEQIEYEQRTALAFQVERLASAVSNCAGQCVPHAIRPDTREEPEAATHARRRVNVTHLPAMAVALC